VNNSLLSQSSEFYKNGLFRFLYGSILLIAVIVAFDHSPPEPWEGIAIVLVSLFGTGLADAYARTITHEIKMARVLSWSEVAANLAQSMWILVPVVPVVLLFLFATAGMLDMTTSLRIAEVVLVSILFTAGFILRRRAGGSVLRSLVDGSFDAAIGLVIVSIRLLGI
jgi:hypothetical protein